jgi:hypothetical protein
MAAWMGAGRLIGSSMLAAALVAGGVGLAQNGGQKNGGTAPPAPAAQVPDQVTPTLDNSKDNLMTEGSIDRLRNSERQKSLVDDTSRLLSLANELKAEVDKSSKDTLSLDVIRKADEIEKLAHSVKEKMKGS